MTKTHTSGIKIGDKVKERVTGLVGIVIARTEWLNGCIRMVVQPQQLKDGVPVKDSQFDVEDLILLEADALNPKVEEKRSGGPMPEVSR